jgi:hypothetical protein
MNRTRRTRQDFIAAGTCVYIETKISQYSYLEILLLSDIPKAGFPLGGILRAERNLSLSFLISSTREITRPRKIPLRAQNSA